MADQETQQEKEAGSPMRGKEPLNLWEAYHKSPPVPWRLLLRQPVVRLGLFLLVCLILWMVR